MRWIFKALANGALELILAAFMALASVLGNAGARLQMPALLTVDLLAAVSVAVVGRYPRAGSAMAMAVAVVGLLLDGDGIGFWPMTLMIVILSLMRTARWRLAAVTFAVIFVLSIITTYRSHLTAEHPLWEAFYTWAALDGFMLILGLGIYAASQHAAELARQESRAVRLRVAVDLHDLVAKDLTLLALDAERARKEGATDKLLLEMELRARAASAALRGTVGYLSAGKMRPKEQTESFEAALKAGADRLNRARCQGRIEGDLNPKLPPSIDIAAGRILAEILFNVSQHGKPKGRWALSAEETDESFDFTVVNERGKSGVVTSGLGTLSIEQFARAVGGHAEYHYDVDDWTCAVTLPLVEERS